MGKEVEYRHGKRAVIDSGGIEYYADNIELLTSVDWGEIISHISNEKVMICTYGDIYQNYLSHFSHMQNLTLVVGVGDATWKGNRIEQAAKKANPACNVYIKENTHAKIMLIEPDEVYISSQNFWKADYFQTTVHIKDAIAYEEYSVAIDSYIHDKRTGNINRSLDTTRYFSSGEPVTNPGFKMVPASAPLMLDNSKIKIAAEVNWNQKFNNVANQKIIITTFSIPDEPYACRIIKKLLDKGNDVHLILHSKFINEAKSLCARVNDSGYATTNMINEDDLFVTRGGSTFKCTAIPNIHAKIVARGDKTIWLSSANFGCSGWFENTVKIEDTRAYDYYITELKKCLKLSGIDEV